MTRCGMQLVLVLLVLWATTTSSFVLERHRHINRQISRVAPLFFFGRLFKNDARSEASKRLNTPSSLANLGDNLLMWFPLGEIVYDEQKMAALYLYLTYYYLTAEETNVYNNGGIFRIRKEDINKEFDYNSNDCYSFRLMFLENIKDQGLRGTADLLFTINRDPSNPGLIVQRYRKSTTEAAKISEKLLLNEMIANLIQINDDPSIKSENRLFKIKKGLIDDVKLLYNL